MGTKNLVMIKTHFDSINTRSVNDFVYRNILRAIGSLCVFLCNYVLYSFGLILKHIFRFHVGDKKNDLPVQPAEVDQTERNLQDSEIDGFRAELINFLFPSREDIEEDSESRERERETERSILMEADSVILEDSKDSEVLSRGFVSMNIVSGVQGDSTNSEGETDYSVSKKTASDETVSSVLMENASDTQEDVNNSNEVETKSTASMEIASGVQGDSTNREAETDCSASKEIASDETVGSLLMENEPDIQEDVKNSIEEETKSTASMEIASGVLGDSTNREGEADCSVSKETASDETVGSLLMENEPGIQEDVKNSIEEETKSTASMEAVSNVNEDGNIREGETKGSLLMDTESDAHEHIKERDEETEISVLMEIDSATTTSKCQHMSGKNISGFMEEPTIMTFSFRQFHLVGPNVSAVFDNALTDTKIIADREFSELSSEKDPVHREEEKPAQEQRPFDGLSTCDRFGLESEVFCGSDSSFEDDLVFNYNSSGSDSESESSSSSGLTWGNSERMDDSFTYEFLAYNNVCEGFEPVSLKAIREKRDEGVEETQSLCDRKMAGIRGQRNYGDEYIELEPHVKHLKTWDEHVYSGMDAFNDEGKEEKEGSGKEEVAYRDSLEKNEETKWEKKLNELDSDEEDEDEFEWEHDDLVEQLKMELRNARQGGLPTILEEEEEEETQSPKLVEDLKPLKIEEKLEFRDSMNEIQKFYKSYAEKMRKLDILNYQTMHAIGLLQLKDPLRLVSTPKCTVPGAKPLITQNLWPRKAPRNKSDPLLKFVQELHGDLELVYVGQVCLSWEILCWEHRKARELKQYDSQSPHQYNLVAGEFQLFQVLMQRFIENEPFQGPRMQNYVKNRCVIRNLLQVPAMKDDSMKDKNLIKGDEDAIASGRLAEIIEESLRVFWEFVRADKDDGNMIPKDPAITELLVDTKTHLQKKEKKLKDIVRSGNCIVKRFQKHHGDQLDHEQLLAQVELKLISRVLNLSKLKKDQLLWCNEKLNRVRFVNRKVHVEPSFLLFPC